MIFMMTMLTMRSRSSRLFIVLLHLVGVSNHLPKQFHGIVGVHPCSIVLERLELEKYGDGLDGWLRALYQAAEQAAAAAVTASVTSGSGPATTGAAASNTVHRPRLQHGDTTNAVKQDFLADPFWLQDTWDGKCLGPMGFSECGDATLWRIRQRRPLPEERRRQRRWMGVFEESLHYDVVEDDHRLVRGFALQLVDPADLLTNTNATLQQQHHQQQQQRGGNHDSIEKQECLLYNNRLGNVEMGSCTGPSSGTRSKLRGWSWKVNQNGVLFLEKSRRKVNQQRLKRQEDALTCLWRVNETQPQLSLCNGESKTQHYSPFNRHAAVRTSDDQQHRVHFALIRYQVTGTFKEDEKPRKEIKERKVEAPSPQQQPRQRLPRTVDIAHSHATTASFQHHHHRPAELKSLPFMTKAKKDDQKDKKASPFSVLKDTNPILFIGEGARGNLDDDEDDPPVEPTTSVHSKPVVLRRIQMNPYIAASQNEKWVDPRTGLEYLTDLCSYLGHDRKESGRHTLVGVGQYVKARIIKIYGVALYVSKRDVLADPASAQFAGLTSEELRTRPDFYSHLRNMPSRTDSNAGLFDRTIFLKTNMQLSTETMRSSLQADWKMLTDEAKDILITTSLKPLPPSESILRTILSPSNPSRCSCAQEAPPEYEADPTCCARGTELVFTWRKNGNVEIRLNGELMDIFPRPDIAKGIFFEYLRYDDPISPDFRDHVVDGFPFLLAPLAQIKGIALPPLSITRTPESRGNALSRAVDGLSDAITSQATDLMDFVQQGVEDMSNHATKAAESAKEAAQNLANEMDQRRRLMWSQMMAASEHSMNVLSGKVRHPIAWASTLMGSSHRKQHQLASMVPTIVPPIATTASRPLMPLQVPRGRALRYPFSYWFGEAPHIQAPDEIEPMVVHPTAHLSHKLFWGLVHLYLLLLLIVSLPGYNTRTKFVLRRRTKEEKTLDSDNTTSDSSESEPEEEEEEEDEEEYLPSFTPEKCEPEPCQIVGDWSNMPLVPDESDSQEQRAKFPTSAKRLLSRGRDALRKVTSRGRLVSSDDDTSQRAQPPVKGRMTKSLSYAL